MYSEITVPPNAPMPQGYAFLPKGIAFKTLHCRKATREAKKPLYVVVDNKRKLGLRAPKSIISEIHKKEKETLTTRRAAVQKRDDSDISKTTAEIKAQFPKMPTTERDLVLKHGFKKHSRRVGRTGTLTLKAKVRLAVVAHIRHKHTDYEALLRAGMPREAARVTILESVDTVMRDWGCAQGHPQRSDGKKATKQKQVAKRKSPRKPSKVSEHEVIDDEGDSDYIP
ncbi:hypothetical protein HBI23_057700 [Parastagonospora nodorum]|nr:hypothetical protein HBI23_057700 [Parastagonospora nodorum]